MSEVVTKDRETYSFSISYGNKSDAIMNNYIADRLKSGLKISSYIRSLIEADMIKNGVIEDNTAPGGYKIKSEIQEVELKLDNITNLLLRLNGENNHSNNYGKDAYDKIVGLEFMLKNMTTMQQPIPVQYNNPITQQQTNANDNLILEKLNNLTLMLKNMGNVDVDLSSIETLNNSIAHVNVNITNKLSDLAELIEESGNISNDREILKLNKSIEKLTDKIESQSETIESLLEIINSQNRKLKQLTVTPNSFDDSFRKVIESEDIEDDDTALIKKKAKKMKKAEF